MSIDLHVHVGAYAEIKPKPRTEILRQLICPKHGLFNLPHEYCPLCGQKTQVKETEIEVKPSLYRLLPEDEYRDQLTWAAAEDDLDVILAISNTGAGTIALDPDNEPSFKEITPDLPSRYITDFIDKHYCVLQVLRQRSISVDVKFGVLTWWS